MYPNINFSFVLPSLGKKHLVSQFLESLERTTRWKTRIEVLFAVDRNSDLDWLDRENYSFGIQVYERPRTEDFTNDYYNYLANRCAGNNIIAFNDDAWIRTKHWDEKILNEIKTYGWSIYMLDIPDTARIKYQHTFPCFPCVSRRAMNTLGWLLHKDVPMYPADQATHTVYYQAKRIIPIRNVLIEHEHIVETDASKSRMMEIYNKTNQNPVDVWNNVMKLALVSGNENNKRQSKISRILNIIQE